MKWTKGDSDDEVKKKTQAEEANQKFIANGCVTGKISRVILTHACLLELISSSVCLDLWLRRHNIRTHTYIHNRLYLAQCWPHADIFSIFFLHKKIANDSIQMRKAKQTAM